MALLGTESIDIAAAAAETTSAATTHDNDINNTSTTVARCAAEADSDEDGGRRRVRFNIPADNIASVEERPSDHYGLMARFVVRYVGGGTTRAARSSPSHHPTSHDFPPTAYDQRIHRDERNDDSFTWRK